MGDKKADKTQGHDSRSNRELGRLIESITDKSKAMSGTGRRGQGRAQNRHQTDVAEEAEHWAKDQANLAKVVELINGDNDKLQQLLDLDKELGAMDADNIPDSKRAKMEQLSREGVKNSETMLAYMKEVKAKLENLRAVLPEPAEATKSAGPSKRTSTRGESSAAASALYDFDPAGDSPAPSPLGNAKRKATERASTRDRERDRSSQQGRGSTPPKAESVEPQAGPSTPQPAGGLPPGGNKSKVIFSKGEEVAFKPKTNSGEPASDWILGEVAQVMGEGKSRRYKVLDVDPDEQSKNKEYRTSASSMIPITPESQISTLKDWDPRTTVLALYPHTTTFYRAEVHSADEEGRVNLKFEGENDSSTLQQVERRFVIEYRA